MMKAISMAAHQYAGTLRLIVLVGIVIGVAGAVLTVLLRSPEIVRCLAAASAAGCESALALRDQYAAWTQMFCWGATGLLTLLALFVSTPLVASEVEQGTAMIAWTLSPSRLRWLLPRMAVVMAAAAVSALVAAVATDAAMWATFDESPFLLFVDWRTRGLPIVGTVMVASACGILAGSLTGRLLPALLVGLALSGGVLIGLYALDMRMLEANPVPYTGGGGIEVYTTFMDRDGRILSADEVYAMYDIYEPGDPVILDLYSLVAVGRPPADAPGAVARSLAIHLAATAVLLAAAAARTVRRRPY